MDPNKNVSWLFEQLSLLPELGKMVPDDSRVKEMLRDRRTKMGIGIEYYDFEIPVTAQEPDPSTVDTGIPLPVPGGN